MYTYIYVYIYVFIILSFYLVLIILILHICTYVIYIIKYTYKINTSDFYIHTYPHVPHASTHRSTQADTHTHTHTHPHTQHTHTQRGTRVQRYLCIYVPSGWLSRQTGSLMRQMWSGRFWVHMITSKSIQIVNYSH